MPYSPNTNRQYMQRTAELSSAYWARSAQPTNRAVSRLVWPKSVDAVE